MDALLSKILSFIFPKAPEWVASLLAVIIPAIISAIRDIKQAGEGEVFEASTAAVASILDEAFDDIPKWAGLDESKRDAIIVGLSELALFIEDMVTDDGEEVTARQVRRAARKIRRAAAD